MIVGIGTDMVEVKRIERSLQRFGERFVHRILLESELRPGLSDDKLTGYLARQFAAKEAVSKVLGTGMRQGVHFRSIQVLRNRAGAPEVTLFESALAQAEALGINQLLVSLSDERDYALAFAIGSKH